MSVIITKQSKSCKISGYGGIGRRASFRLHHVGELAKSRFLLAKNLICGYGGIGRRAWFRSHHVGELAKFRIILQKNTKNFINADMAELADAHGSGPCESNFMQVQVLLSAPKGQLSELSLFSCQDFRKCSKMA